MDRIGNRLIVAERIEVIESGDRHTQGKGTFIAERRKVPVTSDDLHNANTPFVLPFFSFSILLLT